MSSKNSGKSTNPTSRRSKRKDNKKNNNKLINVSSDDENSADNSAIEQQPKRLQAAPGLEAVNKKARTFSEKDMDIDLSSSTASTSSSKNFSQTVASNSAANPAAAVLINTQAQAPILDDAQNDTPLSLLPKEVTQQQQQTIAPENNSLNPLEQRVLDNIAQQQQHVLGSDPLKSRHDPTNMLDDDDDNYDDDVACRGDVPLYRASTPFSDVIRDKESKEACKNKLREYFIETYNEAFINVYLTGKQAVRKLIVILGAEEALTDVCADSHEYLKKDNDAMAPIFHSYDPLAIRIAQRERSITVTDIPLFFTEQDVISAFKKFGTLDSHKFCTPRGANFQKVELTFTDSSVHETFRRRHDTWTRGHFLRVYPATFNKEDQDARMEFTAVLKNLPPNINAIDLAQIFSETGASSIGLPRYTGSYKSKPWAYFSYSTQESRDNAMDLTFSLKGRHLQWIFPSEVKTLCVRCASNEHKTKECNAFEERGRRTISKNVQNNYARFKPVGYVKPPTPINKSREGSTSRSRSRSCSRKSTNPKNNDEQRDNKNKDNNKDNQLSPNKKTVTYAEQAASPSLQSSIHAPTSSTSSTKSSNLLSQIPTPTQDKGKGRADNTNQLIVDQTARDAIAKVAKDLNAALQQLAKVQSEFTQMKNRFDSIDNKLDKIVSFCNITTNTQTAPTGPIPVNIPTNPINTPQTHRNILPRPTMQNPFPQNTQRQSTPVPPQRPTNVPYNESNTVDRKEFASAMGQMNQLQNNFGNISAQLAQITKFLNGANTQ